MKEGMPRTAPRRLVVGITGASGVAYGVRLLELLKQTDVESHLVMTDSAVITLGYEMKLKVQDVHRLADVVHQNSDIGASLASGSFKTLGMIVAPCSVKTLAAIATGYTDSLLARAADVALKERRRLVLMVRETPLHLGHLRAMVAVTEAGAIVMPPVPAFYANPRSLDEMIDQTVGRALDLFDIETGKVKRWKPGSARGTK
jgi:4-hydroxy-3-polyprenylbenzoate decarboxylase